MQIATRTQLFQSACFVLHLANLIHSYMYHNAYTSVYNRIGHMSSAPLPNKHQQRSEATRRKLLASARRIFARDGFEAARIEDIASHAGHTRGAFYANFDTKESLFLALLEQQVSEHVSRLLNVCKPNPTGDKIAAFRKYYLERASDREWWMLLLEFKLFAVRHPRLRTRLGPCASRDPRRCEKPGRCAVSQGRHTSRRMRRSALRSNRFLAG